MARANKHVDMATKFVNGEHAFHQHYGTWDEECVHGCGYIHLSSSTAGTRKKCCANGCLSSVSDSDNFDEELMNEHELDPMPLFLRENISMCTDISRNLGMPAEMQWLNTCFTLLGVRVEQVNRRCSKNFMLHAE
jgi:hypothetical protein